MVHYPLTENLNQQVIFHKIGNQFGKDYQKVRTLLRNDHWQHHLELR